MLITQHQHTPSKYENENHDRVILISICSSITINIQAFSNCRNNRQSHLLTMFYYTTPTFSIRAVTLCTSFVIYATFLTSVTTLCTLFCCRQWPMMCIISPHYLYYILHQTQVIRIQSPSSSVKIKPMTMRLKATCSTVNSVTNAINSCHQDP